MILESRGRTAEYYGHCLGEFLLEEGLTDGKPYWKQRHDGVGGLYLFWRDLGSTYRRWLVGNDTSRTNPFPSPAALRNKLDTPLPPNDTQGLEYDNSC